MDDQQNQNNQQPQPPQQFTPIYGPPPPPPPPPAPPPSNGKAVGSLVLGIAALVFAWFGWFSLLAIAMAVVGVLLGVAARKETPPGQSTGIATGGLVCSVIALVLSSITFVACALCTACGAASIGSLGAW